VLPSGEFELKSPVLFRELAHFLPQPLVLKPCIPFSSRMGRGSGHCRLALCHQEFDIPIPSLKLGHQVLIFFLDRSKLFLQLPRGGRSSSRISVEVDFANGGDDEGLIFCRNKGGVQGHCRVILVRKRKRETLGRMDVDTEGFGSGGSDGTRGFGRFEPLTGVKWGPTCWACGSNCIGAGLHMLVHTFLAMKMPCAHPTRCSGAVRVNCMVITHRRAWKQDF
jgi:hypothetical protein